jgi:hypothetical protein
MKCRLCGEPHNNWYTCQSWKDSQHSLELERNHKTGRYCKEWQHCSVCCSIKHYFRILRHFSGRCVDRKNNRCPVCYESKKACGYAGKIKSRYYSKVRSIVYILYKTMLVG